MIKSNIFRIYPLILFQGTFQYGKKQVPIELSNSISFNYVTNPDVNSQKYNLDEKEIERSLDSMKYMKQWESKKPINVESGINLEDNKKILRIGPRSIKQLTGK